MYLSLLLLLVNAMCILLMSLILPLLMSHTLHPRESYTPLPHESYPLPPFHKSTIFSSSLRSLSSWNRIFRFLMHSILLPHETDTPPSHKSYTLPPPQGPNIPPSPTPFPPWGSWSLRRTHTHAPPLCLGSILTLQKWGCLLVNTDGLDITVSCSWTRFPTPVREGQSLCRK